MGLVFSWDRESLGPGADTSAARLTASLFTIEAQTTGGRVTNAARIILQLARPNAALSLYLNSAGATAGNSVSSGRVKGTDTNNVALSFNPPRSMGVIAWAETTRTMCWPAMRRYWMLGSALLVIAAATRGAARAAQEAEPEPSAIRQNEFSIPFRLTPPADPAQQPVEVQLHATADHGITWQVASRVKPTAARFVFRAPHDGDYWFCIRTVDRQGTTRPEGPQKAELKVIVDTLPPRLDLTATRGPAGEITAHWQIVDPNLKPESLTIEYQPAPNQPWERLAIEPATATARFTSTGETTWWPKSADGGATVRAQVTDRAGNPAVSLVQVNAGAATQEAASQNAVKTTPPAAAKADSVSAGRNSEDRTDDLANSTSGRVNWPADRAPSDDQQRGQNRSLPAGGSTDPFMTKSPARLASSSRTAQAPEAGNRHTPEPTFTPSDMARGGLRFDLLPPGERPQMINARRFELEYDIDTVGPSVIARVELWGTTDGGKTWKSFGIDNDNRSPLLVNVPGEGLYGFTIVFQNGNGFGGFPPREGDVPEIWVGVDLTPPTVKITGTEMGRDAGELLIHWEAEDELLDPGPLACRSASARRSLGRNCRWT